METVHQTLNPLPTHDQAFTEWGGEQRVALVTGYGRGKGSLVEAFKRENEFIEDEKTWAGSSRSLGPALLSHMPSLTKHKDLNINNIRYFQMVNTER